MSKRYRALSRLVKGKVNRLHRDVVDTDNNWDVLMTYRQKKKAVELARELNSSSGWQGNYQR